MASEVVNPSVELSSLPYPLKGALKGGQRIILSYSPSELAAACPSLGGVFRVRDIGSWSGSVDDSSYGLASGQTVAQTVTVNDATNNDISAGMTLSHTTSGTASAGIGAGLVFKAENGAGTAKVAAYVAGVLSTVTDGAEVGKLALYPAAADAPTAGLEVQGVASAVNGLTVLPAAASGVVRVYPNGETNVSVRYAGKGTGYVALANPANSAMLVQVNATGLGLWGATPAAQPSHIPDLTATVAGDMPGPTAAEITTRLNLIESKLNVLLAALRTPGVLASS